MPKVNNILPNRKNTSRPAISVLDELNFVLPPAMIAQKPASPRDHARLLVYKRTDNSITDDYFYNLNIYLPAKSTLVLNNSRVDKCRLKFGEIEIFILEDLNSKMVRALVRPGKKFKVGSTLKLAGGIAAETLAVDAEGLRTLKFSLPVNGFDFDKFRLTPLPPYIAQNEELSEEYQTVYAKYAGSIAAPTAGLHFTNKLLAKIKKTHRVAEVTLHVGLGTFAPLRESNVLTDKLHSEKFEVDDYTAAILQQATHITAVGTTSLRVLESLKQFNATNAQTDIFIKPGHHFKNVNALVTNFHLPGTSLLLLVAAFVGSTSETKRIYNHAITNKYRFYSFGDAMLIL